MNQDRDMDKYLAGKSDLSKLYAELPEVVLPNHLDAVILAEAHRAVNSRPGAQQKRRWPVPLGLVASLLVAVMIGLQLPYMLRDSATSQQLKDEKTGKVLDKNMSEPSPSLPFEIIKNQLARESISKPKSDNKPGIPAPVVNEANSPSTQYAPAALAAPKSIENSARSTGAAAALDSTQAAPSSPPAKAAKLIEMKEQVDHFSGIEPPKEKKNANQTETDVSVSLDQKSSPKIRKDLAPAAKQERRLLQSIKAEESDVRQNPEEWLKRIKKLKQAGNLDEASNELFAFKKRYPDYLVPEVYEVK